MSRYFPGNENTPQEQLDRPEWAKGVALTADARETPARMRDRKWLRARFQASTDAVHARLLELLVDDDGRVAVNAARLLMEYGWGRPEQMQPEGAAQRPASADPEALRARVVAVLAEVGPAQVAPVRRGVLDARPALPPDGG